jgi:hypothetical protein
LETEQKKHSEKCVYHLCDNHLTSTCNVKLECDKILAEKQQNPTMGSSSSGHLRHITKELYEGAVDTESNDVESEVMTNDTNEASLHYFARVTNHYLCLVRSSKASNPRHAMQYSIIADSGANCHRFCDLIFFDTITPATGQVILGDGKTSLKIEGIGTVKLKFGDSILSIDNVRYIPSLAESIYSLFVHIQHPNHAVYSSFSEGLSIIFPDFQSKAIIGHDDIFLNATPLRSEAIVFNGFSGSDCPSSEASSSLEFSRHVTQFQKNVSLESSKVDNLLANLCQYYKDIKTRRQLNLEVPAGFWRDNDVQCTMKDATLCKLSQSDSEVDCFSDSSLNLPNMDITPNDSDFVSIPSSNATIVTNNTL